jgi:hypothetical protein
LETGVFAEAVYRIALADGVTERVAYRELDDAGDAA